MRSVYVKVKALFCLFLSLCDVIENEYPCLVCGQLRLIDLTVYPTHLLFKPSLYLRGLKGPV